MDLTLDHDISAEPKVPVGLSHVPLVFTAPSALFARIEDTGGYGKALVVLLLLVLLIGYAQVQTGLIDRVVNLRTETELAKIEATQADALDRLELRDRMDAVRKGGEFTKTISRLGVVVFAPIYFLASFLLIASVLYAVVALTGRKPEYHTLISICVYAGFVELIAVALKFGMMLWYRTTDVDTSLGMLSASTKPTVLSAIDPFRIWFWVLVAMGLIVTRQLSRRMAIVTCSLLVLVATGVRAAAAVAGS